MNAGYDASPPLSLPTPSISRQVRRASERQTRKDSVRLSFDELRSMLETDTRAFFFQAGMLALQEQMEQDADALCGGRKGKHLGDARTAHRHGYETGFIRLGCARVKIRRPRVRTLDNAHERPLPAYEAAQSGAFAWAAVEAACLAGVSQREFGSVATAFAAAPPGNALRDLSKSEVGRRFILATQSQMSKLNARRLDGKRVLVLYVDGIVMAEHTVLAAVVVNEAGEKHLVGVREGSSENGSLCRAFLEDLVARGLTAEKGLLVVLDGGKGLASGVSAVFGARALVQRCRVHKKRNILDKLPDHARDNVSRRLTKIWAMNTVTKAETALQTLARELSLAGHKEAAGSLREGLTETLTCQRLGLPANALLVQSVSNTNLLESIFATHEIVAHRVKNWKHGEMAARWVAAALLKAEKSLRLVGTPEELSQLATLLQRHVDRMCEDGRQEAAEIDRAA